MKPIHRPAWTAAILALLAVHARFLHPTEAATVTSSKPRVLFGDLNGDGRTDRWEVVDDLSSNRITCSCALSNGDGTWGTSTLVATWIIPTGLRCARIQTGDFDGDGRCDLVVVSSTTTGLEVRVETYRSLGKSLAAPVSSTLKVSSGLENVQVLAADVDGDHRDDLVFVRSRLVLTGPDLQLLLSQGIGAWVAANPLSFGTGTGLALQAIVALRIASKQDQASGLFTSFDDRLYLGERLIGRMFDLGILGMLRNGANGIEGLDAIQAMLLSMISDSAGSLRRFERFLRPTEEEVQTVRNSTVRFGGANASGLTSGPIGVFVILVEIIHLAEHIHQLSETYDRSREQTEQTGTTYVDETSPDYVPDVDALRQNEEATLRDAAAASTRAQEAKTPEEKAKAEKEAEAALEAYAKAKAAREEAEKKKAEQEAKAKAESGTKNPIHPPIPDLYVDLPEEIRERYFPEWNGGKMFDITTQFYLRSHRFPPTDPNRDPRVAYPNPESNPREQFTYAELMELLMRTVFYSLSGDTFRPVSNQDDARMQTVDTERKGFRPEVINPDPDRDPIDPSGGDPMPLPVPFGK